MGRFFSFSQIREGGVPKMEDFGVALGLVMKELQEMHKRGLIVSAIPYGSVPRGDFGRRSDLDLFVITVARRHVEALAVLRSLSAKIAQQNYVPVNISVANTRVAGSSFNTFGPSYMGHVLQFVEEGVGEDPGKFVTQPFDRRVEVYSWVVHKMEQTQKFLLDPRYHDGDVTDEPEFLRALGKATDVFFYGTQKVADLHLGESSTEVRKGDLADRLSKFSPELASIVREVHDLVRSYESYLERLLDEAILVEQDRLQYKDCLADMFDDIVRQALDFLTKYIPLHERITR